jgi:hypothetical protein
MPSSDEILPGAHAHGNGWGPERKPFARANDCAGYEQAKPRTNQSAGRRPLGFLLDDSEEESIKPGPIHEHKYLTEHIKAGKYHRSRFQHPYFDWTDFDLSSAESVSHRGENVSGDHDRESTKESNDDDDHQDGRRSRRSPSYRPRMGKAAEGMLDTLNPIKFDWKNPLHLEVLNRWCAQTCLRVTA